MRKELGEYFLDLSKLIFGGVILTGVMGIELDSIALFIVSGITALITALIGFSFIRTEAKKSKKKEKEV